MQDSELERRENEAAAALAVFAIGLGLSSAFHSTIQTRQRWYRPRPAYRNDHLGRWVALMSLVFVAVAALTPYASLSSMR